MAPIPQTWLTRGRLARLAGVHPETVRYYERRGLLPRPARTLSNYRIYPPETARRIRFIKRAQRIGFSLEEIGELLAIRSRKEADCPAVRRKAEERLRRIEARIRELEALRRVLVELTEACRRGEDADRCPILEALEEMEEQAGEGTVPPDEVAAGSRPNRARRSQWKDDRHGFVSSRGCS